MLRFSFSLFAAFLYGKIPAAVCTGGLKVPRALATLLLALVAHAGANVLNDYFDARNGADAANDQGLFPFTQVGPQAHPHIDGRGGAPDC